MAAELRVGDGFGEAVRAWTRELASGVRVVAGSQELVAPGAGSPVVAEIGADARRTELGKKKMATFSGLFCSIASARTETEMRRIRWCLR